MRKVTVTALLLSLSACGANPPVTTASPAPAAPSTLSTITQVLCQVDAVGQPIAVALATPVVAVLAPGEIPEEQLAVQIDAPVHQALQNACPKGATLAGVAATLLSAAPAGK